MAFELPFHVFVTAGFRTRLHARIISVHPVNLTVARDDKLHVGMSDRDVYYRIQLTVAVYKSKKLAHRNDMVVPTYYTRRSEARAHIKREIQERLRNSNFFISPRVDFDLVRYTQEASCNTYLRYRIVEEKAPSLAESIPSVSGSGQESALES